MIKIDKPLVQWEKDRVAIITDRGMANEVHFYNSLCEHALIVEINDDDTANIPNILLQSTLTLHAWLVCDDGTCNKCTSHVTFKIEPRVKPDDYIYTETQVKTFNSLIKEVNDMVSDLEEKRDSGYFNGKDGEPGKDGAPGKDGVDGYTPQKGIDYFDGADGKDGATGKDGYTPQKGVDYYTEEDKAEIDANISMRLDGLSLKKIKQADYDTLTVKDFNTLYIALE